MKGVLKVSKQQVIEVERYCDEHGITRAQRIEELGLSRPSYYYTRGLLSEEEIRGGQFVPIMSDSYSTSKSTPKSKKRNAALLTEPMTIEVRTPSGVEMRLIGNVSVEMLRTILGNV